MCIRHEGLVFVALASKNWQFFSEGFPLTETWICKDWNPQNSQKADSFWFQGQALLDTSNKEGYVTPCISFNASPEKLLGMKLQLQLLAACDKRRCLEGFFEWLEWWLVVGIYQHGSTWDLFLRLYWFYDSWLCHVHFPFWGPNQWLWHRFSNPALSFCWLNWKHTDAAPMGP